MDSFPPPPIRASRAAGLFRALAHYCWVSVLFSLALSVGSELAAQSTETAALRVALYYGMGLVTLTGIIAGVTALIGMAWHGRKGILWPALVGLGVWIALVVLAIPGLLRARQMQQERLASRAKPTTAAPAGQSAKKLATVVHIPGATALEDSDLIFSMDVPARFEPVIGPSKPARFHHAWAQRTTDGSTARILGVSRTGGPASRARMKEEDLPAGSGSTLERFSWRGVSVDATRVPEKDGDSLFVTFNVHIPLRPEAILLTAGGPADAESEVLAVLMQVLASLDGENAR